MHRKKTRPCKGGIIAARFGIRFLAGEMGLIAKAGGETLRVMPEPLPKIPDDPALRVALARGFLATLAAAKSDDDINDWLESNTPRMVDELAIVELAVEECAPGSPWEHLREATAHAAGLIRKRMDEEEQFALEHVKRDFLGASRRVFYEQAECGALPEDWRTREGCKASALRWMHEFYEEIAESVRTKNEGDIAGERLAKIRAHDAIETMMDRVLTLSPEERSSLLPIVEPLYSGMMENRAKNFGE